MKAAALALNDLLNGPGGRSLWMAKCVQLDLVGGGYVLRYTDADVHLELPEVPGVRFIADGARLTVGGATEVLGLEVDEMQITLAPVDTDGTTDRGQTPTLPAPLLTVGHNGGLDRALVTVWRAFAPGPGPTFADLVPVDPNAASSAMLRRYTPVGAIKRFVGYVAGVDVDDIAVTLTVRSGLDLLNQPFPRYVYRVGCVWDLYSSGCGVQKAAWTQGGAVTAGSTRFRISATPTSHSGAAAFDQQAEGFYNEGVLQCLDGPNAFVRRGIKIHRGGKFTLVRPLPYAPAPGNRITVAPGCDKSFATCNLKFGNAPHFRGFPAIPGPDASQGTQLRDVTNEAPNG